MQEGEVSPALLLTHRKGSGLAMPAASCRCCSRLAIPLPTARSGCRWGCMVLFFSPTNPVFFRPRTRLSTNEEARQEGVGGAGKRGAWSRAGCGFARCTMMRAEPGESTRQRGRGAAGAGAEAGAPWRSPPSWLRRPSLRWAQRSRASGGRAGTMSLGPYRSGRTLPSMPGYSKRARRSGPLLPCRRRRTPRAGAGLAAGGCIRAR